MVLCLLLLLAIFLFFVTVTCWPIWSGRNVSCTNCILLIVTICLLSWLFSKCSLQSFIFIPGPFEWVSFCSLVRFFWGAGQIYFLKPTKEEVRDLILSNIIFLRYVGADHSLHGEGEHHCPEQCLVERERELSRDWAAMSSSWSQSHLADEFHFSFQKVEKINRYFTHIQ